MVLWPRQTQMLPQRRPCIIFTKELATLQLWHETIDDVVQPLRQEWKNDSKAVRRLFLQPERKLVGNLLWRPNKSEPRISTITTCELPHRQLLLLGERLDTGTTGLAGVGLGKISRQRSIGIKSMRIGPERN